MQNNVFETRGIRLNSQERKRKRTGNSNLYNIKKIQKELKEKEENKPLSDDGFKAFKHISADIKPRNQSVVLEEKNPLFQKQKKQTI